MALPKAPPKAAMGVSPTAMGARAQHRATAAPAPALTPITLGGGQRVGQHRLDHRAGHRQTGPRRQAACRPGQPHIQDDGGAGPFAPAGQGGRMMDTLSGGQRQKVYLAMALAQQAPTILMDEPTTWLDPKHQLEVMATARRLAAEGRAVGLVSHELSLALRTADQVALLAGGKLAAFGTPEQVYRSGALEEAFGVKIGRSMAENGWHYYYL